MKMSELVSKYIELRDRKAILKSEYEAKVAKIQEVLDKIEAKLLEVFEQTGMESVKTEFGTAYSQVRNSVSCADREVFMQYIKDNEEWSLLEIRPSKAAVEQFLAANEELPPGVNWRSERVVNFRRNT